MNDEEELALTATLQALGIVGVRAETITEVKVLVEKVAKSHDELAARHPSGPDRMKAQTLRQFADLFLP